MSCIIENICYGGDEHNPQNAGEICRPQISEYKWTAGKPCLKFICFSSCTLYLYFVFVFEIS